MIELKAVSASASLRGSELVVVASTKDRPHSAKSPGLDAETNKTLNKHLKKSNFGGNIGDCVVIPTAGSSSPGAVMTVGLGLEKQLDHEKVRRAAGVAGRNAGEYRTVTVDIGGEVPGGARAAAEGFALGAYKFSKYLTEPSEQSEQAKIVGATKPDLDHATAVVQSVSWARDLVNEPPSNRTPQDFVERIREAAGPGLKVEVFDEKALAKLGMNGILTVGKASQSPPRFVVMTHSPKGAKDFIGIVGKGITFDSGGLSLKSSEGMETMKMDCSGAAASIAATLALHRLGVGVKVVAAVALAENMPGGSAAKPGDVIRHFGGRTSEVLNTDAEGRLVLADALAWMSARNPNAMVDLATLTGGMVVALGQKVAGVLSNDQTLASEILKASLSSGEPVWELPLYDEYRRDLDSPVADIKNISGNRWASPIIGGLFLKDFVGDTPWAHLDIAGPAWMDKPEHYLSQGATAFGTRLLIDWVIRREQQVGT